MIKINNILDVEKHLDGIEAVIFDLDDTLYSEKEYVKSGYRAVADSFPEIPSMYDELWAAFEKKEPAIDVVFERHGILIHKEKALKIYRYQKPNISLYPGVREMLGRIRQTKKIGIITDGRPESQHAKLEALGLNDIPYIITDELGGEEFRKPNDTSFRLMQTKFQIQFDKMAYIGDNIRKDFVSPEKLEMTSIYFINSNGLYLVKEK